MSRPGTVTAAFVIWVIAAILQLIASIILFFSFGAAGAAAGSVGLGITIGVVQLIVAIIALVIVFRMRNGANWARIVLTIVGVLQIIGAISSISQGSAYSWLPLAVHVLAVILMYVGGANAFFARR